MNDGVVGRAFLPLIAALVFFASAEAVGRDYAVRAERSSKPTGHDGAAEIQSAAVFYQDPAHYGRDLLVLQLSGSSPHGSQTITKAVVLRDGDWVSDLTPSIVLVVHDGAPIDGLAGRYWREDEWIGPLVVTSSGNHFVDLFYGFPRVTRAGNSQAWRQ